MANQCLRMWNLVRKTVTGLEFWLEAPEIKRKQQQRNSEMRLPRRERRLGRAKHSAVPHHAVIARATQVASRGGRRVRLGAIVATLDELARAVVCAGSVGTSAACS